MKGTLCFILICIFALTDISIAREDDYSSRGNEYPEMGNQGMPPGGDMGQEPGMGERGMSQGNNMGQGGGMGEFGLPPGRWWKKPKVAEKLKLTGQEKKELDNLYIQNRRRLIDLKSNMEKAKFELELIAEEEDFNKSASISLFKKLQEARTNMAVESFTLYVEVRQLLGYGRFQKLKSAMQGRMEQRRGGQGRRGQREGGGPQGGGPQMNNEENFDQNR